MAEDGKEIDGSALCTHCAMCCHGVLHDWGQLEADEVDAMEALGMEIDRTPDYLRFGQPCAMIRGNVCSIYEQRPSVCADYKCAMLRRYTAGEVPLDAALALVEEAKGLFARATAQLRPGTSMRDNRGHLRQFLTGRTSDWTESEKIERGPALLATALLNRFIDRHFRLPRETMMMTPDAAAQPAPGADSEPPDGGVSWRSKLTPHAPLRSPASTHRNPRPR